MQNIDPVALHINSMMQEFIKETCIENDQPDPGIIVLLKTKAWENIHNKRLIELPVDAENRQISEFLFKVIESIKLTITVIYKDVSNNKVLRKETYQDGKITVIDDAACIEDEGRRIITYEYDALNRPKKVIHNYSALPSKSYYITYLYGVDGRTVITTNKLSNDGFIRTEISDKDGNVIRDEDTKTYRTTQYQHGLKVIDELHDTKTGKLIWSHRYSYDDNGYLMVHTHIPVGKKVKIVTRYVYDRDILTDITITEAPLS